jgi:hypothetical protein
LYDFYKICLLRETGSGYFVALDEPPAIQGIKSAKEATEDTPVTKQRVDEFEIPTKPDSTKFTFGKGLYVNFEIHISADTPIETVEAIFKNMRKYLMEND